MSKRALSADENVPIILRFSSQVTPNGTKLTGAPLYGASGGAPDCVKTPNFGIFDVVNY
jgi:hypothetical protein